MYVVLAGVRLDFQREIMEQDGVVPGAPASPEAPPPPPVGVVPVLPVPNAPPPLRRIMFRLHQVFFSLISGFGFEYALTVLHSDFDYFIVFT